MRVRYEASCAEFIAYNLRLHERTQAALPWWRRDAGFGALLTAGILYLGYRTPVALLVGLLVGVWALPRWQRMRLRQNSRREFEQWYGGGRPPLVEMESRDAGFWVRQAGAEVLYPWDRFVAAEETADGGLEMRLKHDGLIWVSPRAFPDEPSRDRFLGELRNRWSERDGTTG